MTYLPLIPFANVRLQKVEGSGTSEDYGQAEGLDAARWTGDADAYLGERLVTEIENGELNQVGLRRLTFAANLNTGVQLGDHVTYEQDGILRRRQVREIEELDVVGLIRVQVSRE